MVLRPLVRIVAGLGAGYVATKALDRASSAFYARQSEEAREREEELRDELPTVEFVRKVASWRSMKLDEEDERRLARYVHFGLGAAGGPAAQVLARVSGMRVLAAGFVTGLAIFVFVDEGANYVLGLTAPAPDWPAEAHLRGLASHAVYGAVLGAVLAASERLLAQR